MGRFYLDLEFTNGNYYLADIIEMSIVAADTNHEFHRYVRIPYPIPPIVKKLTNITDETLVTYGSSFRDAMQALVHFISTESTGTDHPIIIAHGGYFTDFPILFANCFKYGFHDLDVFQRCTFVDSVKLLQNVGYVKPGLDALCNNLGLSRCTHHSALEDARLLKVVFERLHLRPSHGYSVLDINSYLCVKMPLSIQLVSHWARQCSSSQELQSFLLPYAWKKTALNINQIANISYLYCTCFV